MEFLDHLVTLYLIFEELQSCFPQQLHYFTFIPTMSGDSVHPCPHSLLPVFDHNHPRVSEVASIVVLIFNSLMTNDVEPLFCVLTGHFYISWRNLYSDPLPTFQFDICLVIKFPGDLGISFKLTYYET